MPTPGHSISESLLAEFEQELLTTRRFIERLPENQLTWRPHAKSMTAGQLALHLAETPAGVLQLSLQDEATPPDFSSREQPTSLRQILDRLAHGAAYIRATLPTIDDDRLRSTFKIAQAGQTIMSLPRAAFLRSIMLNHWYQHRGQFGVYLRLLGSTVPSSYGPSADE